MSFIRSFGAPIALKLASSERFNLPLILICLTPHLLASCGKGHSGVCYVILSQWLSNNLLLVVDTLLSIALSSRG